MRTTSTAAAGLNESFQEADKARILAHGGIAQLLLPLGSSLWRVFEDSLLRCYAVSDGPRWLFVFLSSPRPTDKAQAEVWVTSSVRMCGIILLLLLSWQREDTWQMLFCSLMQAFVFLSNCFGICRMGLERREMCVCFVFSWKAKYLPECMTLIVALSGHYIRNGKSYRQLLSIISYKMIHTAYYVFTVWVNLMKPVKNISGSY